MAAKKEKEDIAGDEQIRLDPYYVFDMHFHENDRKGTGKGKGNCG